MKTVEYRVRPVTRYIVTKYEETETGGSSEQLGEFLNESVAEATAGVFADVESRKADPDDMIIRHDRAYWQPDAGTWIDEDSDGMVVR